MPLLQLSTSQLQWCSGIPDKSQILMFEEFTIEGKVSKEDKTSVIIVGKTLLGKFEEYKDNQV